MSFESTTSAAPSEASSRVMAPRPTTPAARGALPSRKSFGMFGEPEQTQVGGTFFGGASSSTAPAVPYIQDRTLPIIIGSEHSVRGLAAASAAAHSPFSAAQSPFHRPGPGLGPGPGPHAAPISGPGGEAADHGIKSDGLASLYGYLDACCCAEGTDARARSETVERGLEASYVYGEEAVLHQHPIFPTMLKNHEGSKSSTESGPSLADPYSSPYAMPYGGQQNPRFQWAPDGVLASLLGVGAGMEDVRECPEIEIESGARYTGQWLGNERHGRGILITSDGLRYEGQFRRGMAHGRGVFIEADGSRFEGQWDQDSKHGHGVFTHSDGTTYEGQWVKDAKSGSGTEVWADGALYQGEFSDGFKHGVGIYRGSGGVEYEGQFAEDKMHGEGCYRFSGGRKYFGQWVDGHMNGHGRMEWLSGAVYEGEYENDLKSGEGVFVWPDGRRYSGQWHGGKQHGTGISEDGKGFRSKDTWEKGKLIHSEELPLVEEEANEDDWDSAGWSLG